MLLLFDCSRANQMKMYIMIALEIESYELRLASYNNRTLESTSTTVHITQVIIKLTYILFFVQNCGRKNKTWVPAIEDTGSNVQHKNRFCWQVYDRPAIRRPACWLNRENYLIQVNGLLILVHTFHYETNEYYVLYVNKKYFLSRNAI